MNSFHQLIHGDSRTISLIPESVDLVVTSPPYPMIEMWDDDFACQNPRIKTALEKGDGSSAFEMMHNELSKVWENFKKAVKPGGIVCINIGDTTRRSGNNFRLYSNHTKIVEKFLELGFINLPNVLWRKPTNSPTKFMGSGMLPPGAYVTLEHEYILIFRKGNKKIFDTENKKVTRNESAYFWEERNIWFSDVWDLKGTPQKIYNGVRDRSGAFPFELAYRLINMFSVKGDLIYDPFLGLGTTVFACIASGRSSIGTEIERGLIEKIKKPDLKKLKEEINHYLINRIRKHLSFVEIKEKESGKGYFKYQNRNYKFPVMTKQEQNLLINLIKEIQFENDTFKSEYYNEALLDVPGSINKNSILKF
jgi:DNA modification methylase